MPVNFVGMTNAVDTMCHKLTFAIINISITVRFSIDIFVLGYDLNLTMILILVSMIEGEVGKFVSLNYTALLYLYY